MRQRYVDLIVNDEAREMLELRARVVRSVRESLWKRGFIEVETPMLQPIHGGANARPFVTHINAYDMRLYLRIAPELYLKKLLVGGAPKVFEMNRNFRNEGADATHNPEFTSIEIYDAYGDYDTMRVLTRDLIIEAAIAAWGKPVIRRPLPDGGYEEVDISGDWAVMTLHEGISSKLGVEVTPGTDLEELRDLCRNHDIPFDPSWDADQVTLEMYEHLCESTTKMPTFYKDFPHQGLAADPAEAFGSAGCRAVGPGGVRGRTGHRLHRADGPDRAARSAHGAVVARGRGRRGGDGARRGLPAGAGVRHAARRRAGDGHRPAHHLPDRAEHSGDAAVPDRAAGPEVVTLREAGRPSLPEVRLTPATCVTPEDGESTRGPRFAQDLGPGWPRYFARWS